MNNESLLRLILKDIEREQAAQNAATLTKVIKDFAYIIIVHNQCPLASATDILDAINDLKLVRTGTGEPLKGANLIRSILGKKHLSVPTFGSSKHLYFLSYLTMSEDEKEHFRQMSNSARHDYMCTVLTEFESESQEVDHDDALMDVCDSHQQSSFTAQSQGTVHQLAPVA